MARINRDKKSSSSKRGKKKSGNLLAVVIMSTVAVLFGLIIYTFVTVSSEIIPRDKETLCRIDGQYNKHIILLDVTGVYSLIQHKTIRQAIENNVADLAVDEQLQLHFITSSVSDVVQPLMKVCNPGQGEDVDAFFGNANMIKKKWEQKLFRPLNEILTEFDSANTVAAKSPIFETIQMINNQSIKRSEEGTKTRFTIISDFIQHSDDYSFFKNNIENFWRSNYQHKVYTELKDVEMQLLFVRRDGREKYLGKIYLDFWKEYFTKSGSEKVIIKRIEG
jgi:hypothetical protein